MGVTGLWSVLQPCARPIKLEALNRARLAVDASIWIYQFLKAVRDKEGNALRNSHVVGFFRRICKLLFFGIKPVFVFDGGAPALKRQTVLGRKQRREGRRDDAVRTAGKLLAVQMQRRLEEDGERRARQKEVRGAVVDDDEEALPDADKLVYVDEIGMSGQERQQTRKFTKKDAYHLPELQNGIEGMGQPNDPRIMSTEELEEYARHFNSGEDINLYDFSKIDFSGEFFTSLPASDRYNILNAARLRSRLRMGLSKEQLEEMFPDRMAFSKFQIERVRERNELTQRLMNLNGMNDDMFGVNGGRIAGERGREYVLVKNDGVEGGWALGVVSTEKGVGERSKPIDIDALPQNKPLNDDEDSEEEGFEDVPIEGLNRLPKLKRRADAVDDDLAEDIAAQRREFYASRNQRQESDNIDSLFVPEDDTVPKPAATSHAFNETVSDDEEAELNRAIAMSLQQHHRGDSVSEDENADFEDVPMPLYEQKAVEAPKPIAKSSGGMVAHIVNNRASAAVPKRKAGGFVLDDDDDDLDLQAALAASKKQNNTRNIKPAPVLTNIKNPFDGPLPFEKLDFKRPTFTKKQEKEPLHEKDAEGNISMEGGFERENDEDAAKPLPPWLVKNGDIRSDYREQQARDARTNAEDRRQADEEERLYRKNHGIIHVDSSDDEDEVEIVGSASIEAAKHPIDLTAGSAQVSQSENAVDSVETAGNLAEDIRAEPPVSHIPNNPQAEVATPRNDGEMRSEEEEFVEWSDSDHENSAIKATKPHLSKATSSEPRNRVATPTRSPSPLFEDVDMTNSTLPTPPPALFPTESEVRARDDAFNKQADDIISDLDDFDFSDPDDEELLAQLATEAEEHARFASTLNNKSERENAEQYERELKALRNQQKKDRRDADEVSHIMIQECQALLRLFGLPYITAPMEAEAQCAELVQLGLVDGIVTDDSDVFLFGGTRVYKNMFNSNKFVECYLSSDLEKELSLSRPHLISIAQLLGSDYTEGLPGIGPVTALEILSEFPSPSTGLQEFKDWWTDVQLHPAEASKTPGSTFRKKFRRAQAKKLFLPPAFPSRAVEQAYEKPDVDSTPEPFQWGVPDLNRLREFLMATIGWSSERTDEVLVPVIKDMNRRETEGTQSNITRYFTGGVGIGASGSSAAGREKPVGSTRMKEAVKKLKSKKLGEPGRLEGTWGEEAAEWARKNELSAAAEEAKKAAKEAAKEAAKASKVPKPKKRRLHKVTPVEGEQQSTAGDGRDNEVESYDEDEYVEKSKGKGKGKQQRKS